MDGVTKQGSALFDVKEIDDMIKYVVWFAQEERSARLEKAAEMLCEYRAMVSEDEPHDE